MGAPLAHLTPRGAENYRKHHGLAPYACGVCGAPIRIEVAVKVERHVPGDLTPCGLVHFVVTCGSRYCVNRGERGMVEPQPWWDRAARWRGIVPTWRTWTP